jgi:hypothetical protein
MTLQNHLFPLIFIAALGCASTSQRTFPSSTISVPSAKTKAILLEVSTEADSAGKDSKVSYNWAVRNSSHVQATFGGQTIQLDTKDSAEVILGISKGTTPNDVKVSFSIASSGAKTQTAVDIGGAGSSSLAKLLTYDKAVHGLTPGVETEVARGNGAFPSFTLQAR